MEYSASYHLELRGTQGDGVAKEVAVDLLSIQGVIDVFQHLVRERRQALVVVCFFVPELDEINSDGSLVVIVVIIVVMMYAVVTIVVGSGVGLRLLERRARASRGASLQLSL